MIFIDTHSHLYLNQFENDIDEVIKRAAGAQVDKIILPNIDSQSIRSLHNLSDRYPDICVPVMGLHPTHVKEDYQDELDAVFKQFGQYKYIAVGEIGIDLYWDKTYLLQQQQAFEQQLNYALENGLPVVIHARNSFHEIFEIVGETKYNDLQGIFHAFTGDIKMAEQVVGRGFLLGIGGMLTFKNSHLREVIAAIDLCHLVLETDSPYLAPEPYRGKRNESSYIPIIAGYLAQVKKTGIDEVAEITTANAQRLFRL